MFGLNCVALYGLMLLLVGVIIFGLAIAMIVDSIKDYKAEKEYRKTIKERMKA